MWTQRGKKKSGSKHVSPGESAMCRCRTRTVRTRGDTCGLGRGAPDAEAMLRVWVHVVVDRRGRGHVRDLPADAPAHGAEPRADRPAVPTHAAGTRRSASCERGRCMEQAATA